jgi:hypothetical protein
MVREIFVFVKKYFSVRIYFFIVERKVVTIISNKMKTLENNFETKKRRPFYFILFYFDKIPYHNGKRKYLFL